MKALIEIEVTGEFDEPLTNDSIIDILDAVVRDGARSVGLDANFRIIQMYKEGDSN